MGNDPAQPTQGFRLTVPLPVSEVPRANSILFNQQKANPIQPTEGQSEAPAPKAFPLANPPTQGAFLAPGGGH